MPPRAAIITVSPATNAPRLATPFTAPAIGTRLKTFILPDKESNKADKEHSIEQHGKLPLFLFFHDKFYQMDQKQIHKRSYTIKRYM